MGLYLGTCLKMIYWGEIKLSLHLRALLTERVEYLRLLQTHVPVIRACDICVICYIFVVLQLVKERPRCTSVILYWWILFKNSSPKKKKKVVSCTTAWIRADGF